MNSKVAFFTDLHLGVHQNSDRWLNIALNWSEWFRQQLAENNIDEIIFGGDFFHYRDEVNVKCLHAANKILDEFKDYKITMITGNHDSYYKDTSTVNSLSILNSLSKKMSNIFLMFKSVKLKKCSCEPLEC